MSDYKVIRLYKNINKTDATVFVPGSKSITARALLIATLAKGKSVLHGVQFSDDCNTFLQCIKDLGIKVKVCSTSVTVYGCGGKLPVEKASINVGSAGTAARFLTALLAFSEGEFFVDSSAQMKTRPQAPLIEALKGVGATFRFLEKENSFPFIICGVCSPNCNLQVDISKSSQYLSALLISSVCANEALNIKTAGAHGTDYIDMTLKIMADFGVQVAKKGGTYVANTGVCGYMAREYNIEPDVSAACYFYAINKLCGTNISVCGVNRNSMQGDYKFIELIKNFNGGRVDMSAFSDQALTLAAVAPYLQSPTEIVGISHIRGQECDRINAIITNLSAMGVKVEELEDGVKIFPAKPHGATIKTFGDHRVAMAFAVCGTRTDGIIIENAEVCSKTFKEFFNVLDSVTKELST